MRIKSVLLRWYKSFNVNYERSPDRVQDQSFRPWNSLRPAGLSHGDFPFIEIPLEKDITTVVGANESGKSHLIGAITKVLSGMDARNKVPYDRTDLCHYASPRNKNADLWPNIGLQFEVSAEELSGIFKAVGKSDTSIGSGDYVTLTLILSPAEDEQAALLFIDQEKTPDPISHTQLTQLRKLLPEVKFIDSEVAIADQLPLAALIAAYDDPNSLGEPYYEHEVTQELAQCVAQGTFTNKQKLEEVLFNSLKNLHDRLASSKISRDENAGLELLLFKQVLGVPLEALKYLKSVKESERSYAESLISTWNGEIDKVLNLAQYWQQDQEFAIRLNYKQGMLYFEITDKTGCVYTFRDRSSGLKYFLSYYIQAKAIAESLSPMGSIILMDEPDSFLSILGQRNLLAVFESLVETGGDTPSPQLIYATHSPFLLNRNFPQRLRLVRKGDSEEGTQYICESRIRRYEPVRSALGVGCAQTLFMGAVNVLLEGATDQYLLVELIRAFINRKNAGEYLDLNNVVFAPADGAQAIEQLLATSQWGDEVVPTAVVLVDADNEGRSVKKRIVNPEKGRSLLAQDFVLLISDCFSSDSVKQDVVTTEDILTPALYGEAVKAYVKCWYPEKYIACESELTQAMSSEKFGKKGLAADTRELFCSSVFEDNSRRYDKLGVLQQFVEILPALKAEKKWMGDLGETDRRLRKVCQLLKQRTAESERAERKKSGKSNVRRIIRDFMGLHTSSCSLFDLQTRLLERLEREAKSIGPDASKLEILLTELISIAKSLRSTKQEVLADSAWKRWTVVIDGIKKNPLTPLVSPEQLNGDAKRGMTSDAVPPVESAGAMDDNSPVQKSEPSEKESV